jgi:ATP-binding cassette subfamily C exporter for protease/lipase
MTPSSAPHAPSLLALLLQAQKPLLRKAAGFSVVSSLLLLTPTLFMLQVYDRVINSRNTTTLLMLLLCALGLYVLMEILELVRSKLLQGAGWQLDAALREKLHDAAFEASLRQGSASTQPFTDLKTLRDFIFSPAVGALFDLPAALVFLVILFLISAWLGVMALLGAGIQAAIGVRTEKKTMPMLSEANRAAIAAQSYANGVMQNAQVIASMGMQASITRRWSERQRKFLTLQAQASDIAGANTASSKFIQTMQGSLILGAACWLAIKGMLLGGGGMMIVASTLGGRVLAPLVQLISQWRQVVNVRDAYRRLDLVLALVPKRAAAMSLPPPQGKLSVEAVVAAAPGSNVPIIRSVSFTLQPGETMIMIGASAAGKTTLARLLMGIWPTASGKVRLDGADIHTWDKAELGPHLGYLPQNVELIDGTLAENIARFGEIDQDKVLAAAEVVGLSGLITSLPGGYQTRIGEDGAFLSGGQRQRVALARAIYGNPNFVLLDEPNSSLDEAGELALMNTLQALKMRKCSTIVITHRSSIFPIADKILLLREGQVAAFGPRDDVLDALRQASAPRVVAAADNAQQAAGGAA